MSSVEGVNLLTLIETAFKKMIDGLAGRGGVESILQFIDQIGEITPETIPLRQQIKIESMFFERAIGQCQKDMLKRLLPIRERQVVEALGTTCPNCGLMSGLFLAGTPCPKCGVPLKITYEKVVDDLLAEGIHALTPEVVLMYVAYDRLADAYAATYKALQITLKRLAQLLNWEQFRINNPQIRNYMDQYFYGRLSGEQRIPREEKEILQFIVRGNLAGIPVEEAEALIRLGLEVVKYGYLYQVLDAIGAKQRYEDAVAKFTLVYDHINQKIRLRLADLYREEKKPKIYIRKTLTGIYTPCFLLPQEAWETGEIAKEIMLEPIYNMPIFPKADFGAIQTVYAPLGGGKTFLLSGFACFTILNKKGLIFTPINDKTNSFTFASMPLFAYSRRTKRLKTFLESILEVEPQGVPVLTVTPLTTSEDIKNIDPRKHPATKYDVILEIEDPYGFKVDFKELISRLKEIANEYGYSKPVGIICVRNLDRRMEGTKANLDIQIATNMLLEFDGWRKRRISQPVRVIIDEVSYVASSQVVLYGGDALRASAAISDLIKESRRSNLAVDLATQVPLEILPELRNASTNVFFRNLPRARERARSPLDYLVDSLQLKDPTLRSIIIDMNQRQTLGKRYWFWYHEPKRTVNVIRPCPPTFCLHDCRFASVEIFRKYEKISGEEILTKWEKVPRIKAERQRTYIFGTPEF